MTGRRFEIRISDLVLVPLKPLSEVHRDGGGDDGVELQDALSSCLREHRLEQNVLVRVVLQDGKIRFGELFFEITAALEMDRASRAADRRSEDAANMRPVLIEHARAVLDGGAGHPARAPRDQVDLCEGPDDWVPARERFLLLENIELFVGAGDDPLPHLDGHLPEACPQMDRVQERDVKEAVGAAFITAASALHPMLARRGRELYRGLLEKFAVVPDDILHHVVPFNTYR